MEKEGMNKTVVLGCSGKKDRTEWKRTEEPGTFYGLPASMFLSGLLLGI